MTAFQELNRARHWLTPQQYRTLAGQIRAGQAEAAMKGLRRILRKGR